MLSLDLQTYLQKILKATLEAVSQISGEIITSRSKSHILVYKSLFKTRHGSSKPVHFNFVSRLPIEMETSTIATSELASSLKITFRTGIRILLVLPNTLL